MRALVELAIPNIGDGTCLTCGQLVRVELHVREDQADFSGTTTARSGCVRARFAHECPGPVEKT
jgi:hypothetical protein